jgi:hypothetical protein
MKPGATVAFYPDADDPGAELSVCIVARVVSTNDDGTLDLNVEGTLVAKVPQLAEDETATPHTWAP